MLKTRIIPTLLWKDLGLVKGVAFDSWRRLGTVLPSIKVYNSRDVDELVLVDIIASKENTRPDFDIIEDLAMECFVPFTVGGGIRTLEDVRTLLSVGADKIVLNTATFDSPQLISQIAERFGSQCIVLSIDAKRHSNGDYECYRYSGKEKTGKGVLDWAKEIEKAGAGEILLTSIDNDGTMNGYDLELIKMVTQELSIPVIASGGAGNYQDMTDAVLIGGAEAIAAASIFHFTEQTPQAAKLYLKEKGVSVRFS